MSILVRLNKTLGVEAFNEKELETSIEKATRGIVKRFKSSGNEWTADVRKATKFPGGKNDDMTIMMDAMGLSYDIGPQSIYGYIEGKQITTGADFEKAWKDTKNWEEL